MAKTPEKVLQDEALDKLYPYLPINYGAAVLDKYREDKHPLADSMTLERLQNVVRKRGTEPDWDAYKALLSIKKADPVARKPRKQHKSRRQLQTA